MSDGATGVSTSTLHPDLLAAAIKLSASAVDKKHRCELTTDNGCERCQGAPSAVRYEHGFIDVVCDVHADSAEARGALVLRPYGKQR